jgi:hypothetical protein
VLAFELLGRKYERPIVRLKGLELAGSVVQVSEANALVCARGPYRAGCAGPNGAVGCIGATVAMALTARVATAPMASTGAITGPSAATEAGLRGRGAKTRPA